MLQGVTPSPRMFTLHPEVIYALFMILFIGNFVNLGIGRAFAFLYARLGQVSPKVLVPTINGDGHHRRLFGAAETSTTST